VKVVELHQDQIVYLLVVEPTHLKNMGEIGSFPQVGMKINKYLSCHHLVYLFFPIAWMENP